ncbi:MAG TPA: response regulator transcription factor [Gemmatimonadales bacterium]
MTRPTVLLADHNASVAGSIRELLEEAFEVVGVVGSSLELESAFERLTPQVVVTDLMMPDESGLVAARHILERRPATRVVFLSVIDAPAMIRASVLEGVHAYVVKEDAADELVPAINAVLDGQTYISTAGRRGLPQSRP